MELKTKIDGYEIDLDTDMDGTGTTGCWINRGQASGSLEFLSSCGTLDDERTVPVTTINKIASWANANGY